MQPRFIIKSVHLNGARCGESLARGLVQQLVQKKKWWSCLDTFSILVFIFTEQNVKVGKTFTQILPGIRKMEIDSMEAKFSSGRV